jgi:hypothetical protein
MTAPGEVAGFYANKKGGAKLPAQLQMSGFTLQAGGPCQ